MINPPNPYIKDFGSIVYSLKQAGNVPLLIAIGISKIIIRALKITALNIALCGEESLMIFSAFNGPCYSRYCI